MLKKELREWKGKWIEPVQVPINKEPVFTLQEMFSGKILPQRPVEERLHPVKLLKRTFALDPDKELLQATLRMTAHGIYSAKINGRKVTDALFTPDYTSYHSYLQVQEYEITGLLQERNVWSVALADGWYGGRVSVNGGSGQFGDTLEYLLAELDEIAHLPAAIQFLQRLEVGTGGERGLRGTDQQALRRLQREAFEDRSEFQQDVLAEGVDRRFGAVEGQHHDAVAACLDLPVAEAESIETGHRHHVRRAVGRGLS